MAVTIDDDVFTYDDDLGFSKETFVVTGDVETDIVVLALHRASARFLVVDEEGTEHPWSSRTEASELYTPNYVSEPRVTDRGVELYLDCKGAIEPPMSLTLRRVLHEELTLAGVNARVSAVDS